jgi:hypothetical protein
MKRLILALILSIVTAQVMAAGWLILGKAPCIPITYPASPLYQSFAFTDTGWGATFATLATNAIQSPACAQTGTTLTETATTGQHTLQNTVSVAYAGVNVETIFVRDVVGTRNAYVYLYDFLDAGGAGSASVGVNLSNCTILGTNPAATTSPWSGASAVVSSQLINGATWCEVALTFTASSSTQLQPTVVMMNGSSVSYAGDGTSQIGVWGLDFRAGTATACAGTIDLSTGCVFPALALGLAP